MSGITFISRLLVLVVLAGTAGSCKKKYPDGPLLSLSTKSKRLVADWRLSSAVVNGEDKSAYLGFATCWLTIAEQNDYNVTWQERGLDMNTIGKWKWTDRKRSVTFRRDLWFYKFDEDHNLTFNTYNNSQPADITYRVTRLTNRDLWMSHSSGSGDVVELRFNAVTKQR